jgi:hypothetical protein
MASKKGPEKNRYKPRIPLPQKPPKAEPKPNAYDRKDKHKRDWTDELDDDTPPDSKHSG